MPWKTVLKERSLNLVTKELKQARFCYWKVGQYIKNDNLHTHWQTAISPLGRTLNKEQPSVILRGMRLYYAPICYPGQKTLPHGIFIFVRTEKGVWSPPPPPILPISKPIHNQSYTCSQSTLEFCRQNNSLKVLCLKGHQIWQFKKLKIRFLNLSKFSLDPLPIWSQKHQMKKE